MRSQKVAPANFPSAVRQRLIKSVDRTSLLKNLLLWFILFGAVFLLAAPLALHLSYALPSAKPRTIPLQQFSEGRARLYLEYLTRQGPRVSNSRADHLTRAFLISHIQRIQAMADPSIQFELSLQNFSVMNIGPLQNIAVRVSRKGSSVGRPCLMLAAHYDSVEFSPGGSDDGSGLAVLLEVFSNLINDRSITFAQVHLVVLFTAAEEMNLRGAENFVYSHHFKNDVRRFINLDSSGGQEKAILFRAKPSQLVKDYARVPRPHANVIGEEILSMLQFHTDYNIFTTSGGLQGYDFAFYLDGYNYHTSIDDQSMVEAGALQHLGENTLVQSRDLLLANVNIRQPEMYVDDDHMIYFDVLGRHLIYYKQSTSVVVQSVLIGLILLVGFGVIIGDHIWHQRNSPMSSASFSIYFYFGSALRLRIFAISFFFVGYLFSMLSGFLLTIGTTLMLVYVRPMSWYGNSTIAFFIFGLPCLIGVILCQVFWTYLLRRYLSEYPKKNPMELNIINYINRCCFNFERHWALLLVFATLMTISIIVGARSLYLILLWSIFICPIYLIIILVEFASVWLRKSMRLIFNEQGWYWLFAPYVVSVVPLIHTMEMTSRLVRVAIPFMGRSDQAFLWLKELLISGIITLPALIFYLVFIPNIQRTMHYARTLIVLTVAFVIVFIIACAREPFDRTHPRIISVKHTSQTRYELTTTDRWPVLLPNVSRTADIEVVAMNGFGLKPILDQFSRQSGVALQNLICKTAWDCTFRDTFNRRMPVTEVELTSLENLMNYRFTFRHVLAYNIEVDVPAVWNFTVADSDVKPRMETIVDVESTTAMSNFKIYLRILRCDLHDSPFLQAFTTRSTNVALQGKGICDSVTDTVILTVGPAPR